MPTNKETQPVWVVIYRDNVSDVTEVWLYETLELAEMFIVADIKDKWRFATKPENVPPNFKLTQLKEAVEWLEEKGLDSDTWWEIKKKFIENKVMDIKPTPEAEHFEYVKEGINEQHSKNE